MELILKKDIEKLGYKDEVVNVKNGYGQNFLIPQGYAALATPSAKKVLAENLKQRAHKESKLIGEASKVAENIKNAVIKIGAKVGENGKIFGSINTIQLSEALKKAGFNIDRKSISINEEPIKTIGTYDAKVALHKEVKGEFKFEVIEE